MSIKEEEPRKGEETKENSSHSRTSTKKRKMNQTDLLFQSEGDSYEVINRPEQEMSSTR